MWWQNGAFNQRLLNSGSENTTRKMKLLRKILYITFYLFEKMQIPVMFFYSWKFGQLKHLEKEELTIWIRSMQRMLKDYCQAAYNFRIHRMINAFALTKVEIIRQQELPDYIEPIVVLCVKNEMARIKMLVEHYRRFGVKRFAFLDNNSDDGTFEWLLEQEDVDLYKTEQKYETVVKEGWINRLISYYGFDRWYIVTDSDELMEWIGMEKHPISEMIRYAAAHGIKRFKGLTLDTYTNGEAFVRTENIMYDYRFVDRDSYFIKTISTGTTTLDQFYGGPRNRLMGVTVPLSKYPLVYFEKGTISVSAHYFYPIELNNVDSCYVAILHYKFIDKDREEYKRRAQNNSGFSSNGRHYKQMLEHLDTSFSFMYDGSIEIMSSYDLSNIALIERIPFDSYE